jgi:hypothetical protein
MFTRTTRLIAVVALFLRPISAVAQSPRQAYEDLIPLILEVATADKWVPVKAMTTGPVFVDLSSLARPGVPPEFAGALDEDRIREQVKQRFVNRSYESVRKLSHIRDNGRVISFYALEVSPFLVRVEFSSEAMLPDVGVGGFIVEAVFRKNKEGKWVLSSEELVGEI